MGEACDGLMSEASNSLRARGNPAVRIMGMGSIGLHRFSFTPGTWDVVLHSNFADFAGVRASGFGFPSVNVATRDTLTQF
jgi:hypothetical protein